MRREINKPVSGKPTPGNDRMEGVETLLGDIRALIEETRSAVAATVNAGLTMLYWRVGQRIRQEILKGKRAEYGKGILPTLAAKLTRDYGRGFAEKNLRRMIQFAEVFPDERIVVTLSRQLGWSHFLALIPLDKPLQRDFYAEMCRIEGWSVRTLRQKIHSLLWIDPSKTLVGYEISFTRHFYRPVPMRTLEEIRSNIYVLEQETEGLLEQIVGEKG